MAKYNLAPDQLLVVDDLKPAWEMCRNAGVPIAFAGWSKLEVPQITAEMTSLCNFAFSSTEELEKFLFD
jgi:phosphoglycolate phosphatase/pyrophosphatase PpaX